MTLLLHSSYPLIKHQFLSNILLWITQTFNFFLDFLCIFHEALPLLIGSFIPFLFVMLKILPLTVTPNHQIKLPIFLLPFYFHLLLRYRLPLHHSLLHFPPHYFLTHHNLLHQIHYYLICFQAFHYLFMLSHIIYPI